MNLIDNLFKEAVGNNGKSLILFTASLRVEILRYLNDDFNFESNLRKLNLHDQLTVRNAKDRETQTKKLVAKIIELFALNSVISFYRGTQFDWSRNLKFEYNSFGKPFLPEQEQFHFQFNSSTSNNLVVTVVELNSDDAIGVDLSHSRQRGIFSLDFVKHFQPILSLNEQKYLSSFQDINERYFVFNHIWTLKEAFTKLLGCGLNIDLSKFNFVFDRRGSLKRDYTSMEFEIGHPFSALNLKWDENISIDISSLVAEDSSHLDKLTSNELRCRSAVIKNGNSEDLPVIVSVISQSHLRDYISCYELNLFDLIMNTQ